MPKTSVPGKPAVAAIAVAMGTCLVLSALATAEEGHPDEPAQANSDSSTTKTDGSTYAGWRLFQAKCATCHGPDATGTTRGPDLLPRVGEMSKRTFVNLVLRRYDWTIGSNEAAGARQAFIEDVLQRRQGDVTMPAWEDEPSIKANILDLYAYLKARADGALGPGRPAQ